MTAWNMVCMDGGSEDDLWMDTDYDYESDSSLEGICEPDLGKPSVWDPCAIRTMRAQVEICQSPDFVIIYKSNNPSSKCCHLLRRLAVLYEGEISLHF